MSELWSNAVLVGQISLLESLKEMIEDEDDIRRIDFELLIEKGIRDISDSDLADSIREITQERNPSKFLEIKFK